MTNQEKTDLENRNTCKRIAEELDAVAAGRVYRCPECGELITVQDGDDAPTRCNSCGADFDEYDAEPCSMYDYFADAMDVEYRIGADREYRSVQVMIACGGPNIYVDTASKAVELYWWGDRASYLLLSDTVDAIDECFSELFNM
jgi:predicted RNA-binding Zn-ribbon protein involved in translation (DUF1610 family)